MKILKKLRDIHCKGCKHEYRKDGLNCCVKKYGLLLEAKKLFCFKKEVSNAK